MPFEDIGFHLFSPGGRGPNLVGGFAGWFGLEESIYTQRPSKSELLYQELGPGERKKIACLCVFLISGERDWTVCCLPGILWILWHSCATTRPTVLKTRWAENQDESQIKWNSIQPAQAAFHSGPGFTTCEIMMDLTLTIKWASQLLFPWHLPTPNICGHFWRSVHVHSFLLFPNHFHLFNASSWVSLSLFCCICFHSARLKISSSG